MFIAAELVYKNYIPDDIKPGMMFIQHLHPGTIKDTIEVFIVEKAPLDDEKFIAENGFPIELMILDAFDGEVLAKHNNIGWLDLGDDIDYLEDLKPKDINIILNDWSGQLDIEVNDTTGEPILSQGLITVRILSPDNYIEIDEEEEELPLCTLCNGSGEGMHDGAICTQCGGSGVIKNNNQEWDIDDYMKH